MLQIDVACLCLVVYKGLLHACVDRLTGGGMGCDLRHTKLTYQNGFKDCVWLFCVFIIQLLIIYNFLICYLYIYIYIYIYLYTHTRAYTHLYTHTHTHTHTNTHTHTH